MALDAGGTAAVVIVLLFVFFAIIGFIYFRVLKRRALRLEQGKVVVTVTLEFLGKVGDVIQTGVNKVQAGVNAGVANIQAGLGDLGPLIGGKRHGNGMGESSVSGKAAYTKADSVRNPMFDIEIESVENGTTGVRAGSVTGLVEEEDNIYTVNYNDQGMEMEGPRNNGAIANGSKSSTTTGSKRTIASSASSSSYNPLHHVDDEVEVESALPAHLLTNSSHKEEVEIMENVHMEGVAKAGYLFKKSTGYKKTWLKRWFFIQDGKLFYTHSREDITGTSTNLHTEGRKEIKREIEAVQVANLLISTVKIISSLHFQIVSPGSRDKRQGGVYDLQGEREDDVEDWVRVIRGQIEGSLVKNLHATEANKNSQNSSSTSSNSSSSSSSAFFVPSTQTLAQLLTANPTCVDCDEKQPDWASLNLCVMMCIQCSGIHRKLGAHITKVRSLGLDKWTNNSIQLLHKIGNQRANRVWEGGRKEDTDSQLLARLTPASTLQQRDIYITEKYKNKGLFLSRHVNSTQTQKNDAIFSASSKGDHFQLYAALSAGADVNALGGKEQMQTALHVAVESQSVLCVELLCQWDALPDIQDKNGHTPMDIATKLAAKAKSNEERQVGSDIIDILTVNSKNRKRDG